MPAPPISHQTRTPDGLMLVRHSWVPVVPPKATLLIVHGFAEHSLRYEHVAHYFTNAGFAVYAYDMRGHGLSDGKRAYIDHFDQLVTDLAHVHQEVTDAFADLPSFILAHSIGTTVTLKYLIDHRPKPKGVILSGTALVPGDDIPQILIKLSGFIGKLLPTLPTIKLDADSVSRDPAVRSAYRSDPFVFTDRIPARTGAEFNAAFAYLQGKLNQLVTPLLMLHGTGDKLINPAGSRLLADKAGSSDKKLHLWEHLYHEILNEPEKQEIMKEIEDWITDRL